MICFCFYPILPLYFHCSTSCTVLLLPMLTLYKILCHRRGWHIEAPSKTVKRPCVYNEQQKCIIQTCSAEPPNKPEGTRGRGGEVRGQEGIEGPREVGGGDAETRRSMMGRDHACNGDVPSHNLNSIYQPYAVAVVFPQNHPRNRYFRVRVRTSSHVMVHSLPASRVPPSHLSFRCKESPASSICRVLTFIGVIFVLQSQRVGTGKNFNEWPLAVSRQHAWLHRRWPRKRSL